MPRLKNKLPSYRLHKASGNAVVTLNGRDVYLGTFNSEESREAYVCCLSRNWTFPDPGLACPGKGNDHEERT